MHTAQETFDKIARGLIKQGQPSFRVLDGARQPMYRTVIDGKVCKCAAGQLITAKAYSEVLEGSNLYDTLNAKVINDLGWHIWTARDLQEIHDGYVNVMLRIDEPFVPWIKVRFRNYAECNRLSAAVLE